MDPSPGGGGLPTELQQQQQQQQQQQRHQQQQRQNHQHGGSVVGAMQQQQQHQQQQHVDNSRMQHAPGPYNMPGQDVGAANRPPPPPAVRSFGVTSQHGYHMDHHETPHQQMSNQQQPNGGGRHNPSPPAPHAFGQQQQPQQHRPPGFAQPSQQPSNVVMQQNQVQQMQHQPKDGNMVVGKVVSGARNTPTAPAQSTSHSPLNQQQQMMGINPAAQLQQQQQQQHMMHSQRHPQQPMSPTANTHPQMQQHGPPMQHHPLQQQQHQQQNIAPVLNQPGNVINNNNMPGGGGGLAVQQQQAVAAHPGMRELRVEDALLYLDDVKREFKNFPGVYNEFLTIMKNFKTQEVDTPGVIQRVSKLFRGYNRLILGFNTFLPDGYKISLADLQRIEAEERAREQAAAMQQQQQQQQQMRQAPPPQVLQLQHQPPQPGRPQVGPMMPGEVVSQQQHQQQLLQQPGANHSMQQGQPHTEEYDGYPSNDKPTARPGQQAPQAPVRNGKQATEGKAPTSTQQQQESAKSKAGRPKGRINRVSAAAQAPLQQDQAAAAPPAVQQQQHQAVEFDHAISYVTTIKRRFANDPSTYHSFLEILHTYQKEQRGIKEVLEQVAHLFQDHPDLLKEFTFFLPDAVQDQAKERLHRAAAESESRMREAQRERMQHHYQQHPQQQAGVAVSASGAASAGAIASGPPGQQQKIIDMTRSQMSGGADGAASRKRPLDLAPPPVVPQQPEVFVYNSAVERQFFDAAREALTTYTRDGGQAWAEFMKCLDMYAQEILSRTEMLNFVEPLLGKRNAKLFEEFKRILAAAGATNGPAPPSEDSWYSVPLSEIDFSRCRRCSPSYRALPRDYPAPPCSERNDEEAHVLNDIWVSLPVGSEESYTFRHMRRITYEEILFRCEDERFEIDMVIDCNAATLQRLLPVAEEIAQLSQEEIVTVESGAKPSIEGAGISGKRFQYTFDKNILGVIHRNSIARIYGDSGQEILDLLVKNPTVAIPLVVERLQQKDNEWKAVRDRLNLHWRELAEHNYYKSLDHRSLTWRTTDKRATSTRTLLAEIKDRAQNGGKEGKEALRQKIEKAKEEHGTFYEVTKAETLSHNLDLTFLPKPDRLLFTPHLSVMYENNSWAQRDAYRILSFALERGPISPNDKERCHRLWVQFFGPWFGLPLAWMHKPAAAYQEQTTRPKSNMLVAPPVVVSEEEESMDEDTELEGNVVTEEMGQANKASGDRDLMDAHPLPCGTLVSTLYGEGTILNFRSSDHVYVIKLIFGATGYMRVSSVLSSLQPVEPSASTEQLRSEDRTKLARPGDQLAIGTQSLFLFFRLHQILVKRLNVARHLAYTVGEDKSLTTLVEQMPNLNPSATGRRRYEAYLALLYALLDGGVGEGGKYEDRVRSLLGHGAYELATMDKLISHLWKNLQAMAQDETMWNLIQLYRSHKEAGSFQPESFRQEAAYLSEHEPMYAFQICPVQDKDEAVMYMEYLGVIAEVEDDDDMMEEDVAASTTEEAGVETEASEAPPPPASKRQRR